MSPKKVFFCKKYWYFWKLGVFVTPWRTNCLSHFFLKAERYGSHFHCESSSPWDSPIASNRFPKYPPIRAYEGLVVFVTPWRTNEGGRERLGHFKIDRSGRHLLGWICFRTSKYLRKSLKEVTQSLFWISGGVFWDWPLYFT